MKRRSILLALLFSIFTGGIYCIYWFVSITNDTNKLAPKHATMNGVAAFLMIWITGTLYYLYWSLRMGQKAGDIKQSGSEGLIYLVLALLTFGIVPLCMAQSTLNGALKC